MGCLIAVTGKGGVGKTSLSGLLVRNLIMNKKIPVLAVDADPNTCLDQALGIKLSKTIGKVREEAGEEARKGISAGISKQQMIEMKVAESLVEAKDFDFIAMGRPEGPGCYCYANNVLKSAIQQISSNYPYVLLDNEAGLENLSRRIVQKVDLLIMVADPSFRGIETLKRLYLLAKEMDIKFGKIAFIINRLRSNHYPEQAELLKSELGIDYLIGIPDNSELAAYSEEGRPLLELPDNNEVVKRLNQLLKDAGIIN